MITPFGPPNDDLDRLNTILDAQVTGKRAPESNLASDADALAATAHLVSGQSIDAREHASSGTLDSIWRNVMHVDALPESPMVTGSLPGTLDSIWRNIMHADAVPESPMVTGSLPGAIRSSDRYRGVRGPESSTSSWWLSVAAVAVLLLGIVGGAWAMRQGNGGGDEPIRLGAVVPLGTPTESSQWSTWITPEECTLEPKMPSDVARLQAKESEDWLIPTYGPVSRPLLTDAEAAATASRALTSCYMYRSDGIYSSEPYLWRYTSPNSPLFDVTASTEHQEANGRDVSHDLKDIEPSDLVLTSRVQPTSVQKELPVTFLPDQAIQFPDGRIGVPMAYLVPEDSSLDIPETLYTTMFVLADESGSWLLDDSLLVCIGNCENYFNGGAWQANEFLATGDAPSQDSAAATPVASRGNEMNWLSWVTLEE